MKVFFCVAHCNIVSHESIHVATEFKLDYKVFTCFSASFPVETLKKKTSSMVSAEANWDWLSNNIFVIVRMPAGDKK